jgi:glycosyltransferase involved in cell wall biosynthesis
MSAEPLLSIIIPVFNTESSYLKKCFAIFHQYRDDRIEIIIIDDGSDKSTAKELDQIQQNLVIPAKLIHKKNGGQNSARNIGIDQSSGKYLFFLDSDDYLAWSSLEAVLTTLELNLPDLLAVNCKTINSRGATTGVRTLQKKQNGALDRRSAILNAGPLWLLVFRKSFLQEAITNLPENISIGEDLACVIPMIILAPITLSTSIDLYRYVDRSTSILHKTLSSDQLLSISRAFTLIQQSLSPYQYDKYLPEIEWLAVKHLMIYGIGRVIAQEGPRSPKIGILSEYCNRHFPDWRNNHYQFDDSFNKTIKYKLLRNSHYRLYHIVYHIHQLLVRLRFLR